MRDETKGYCTRCAMEEVANPPAMCADCTEKERASEVDALLVKNGLSRDEVSAVDENDPMAILQEANAPTPDPHCTDDLSEPEPTPEPEPVIHNQGGYPGGPVAPLNGAATKIADVMVPAFGETLEKYQPGAIAYGFPPAVDALITKTGIDSHRAEMVLTNFRHAFALAEEWHKRATAIVVTDETQTDLMAEARRLHKIVRDDRINVENKRKELKQPALREGQLIDGVANAYKDLLAPIETHLLAQAKFAENREAERRKVLAEERGAKLALFDIDPKTFPNLGDMTDEAFEIVYNGVRQKHTELQAEAQARIERERQFEIENEKLRQENVRIEAERKAEADRAAEQKRIADEANAKLRAAEDAEAKKEAARLAEEERLRLAPDKDKLLAYADRIKALSSDLPDVDEKAFWQLLQNVERDLETAVTRINEAVLSEVSA